MGSIKLYLFIVLSYFCGFHDSKESHKRYFSLMLHAGGETFCHCLSNYRHIIHQNDLLHTYRSTNKSYLWHTYCIFILIVPFSGSWKGSVGREQGITIDISHYNYLCRAKAPIILKCNNFLTIKQCVSAIILQLIF